MSDLIDRTAAIDEIKKDIMGGLNYESILRRLPAIDAEPVRRGRWEVIFYDNIPKIAKCSECGERLFLTKEDYPIRHISNYCPHCGAKMEEGDAD